MRPVEFNKSNLKKLDVFRRNKYSTKEVQVTAVFMLEQRIETQSRLPGTAREPFDLIADQ